jgi:hypothetical protein
LGIKEFVIRDDLKTSWPATTFEAMYCDFDKVLVNFMIMVDPISSVTAKEFIDMELLKYVMEPKLVKVKVDKKLPKNPIDTSTLTSSTNRAFTHICDELFDFFFVAAKKTRRGEETAEGRVRAELDLEVDEHGFTVYKRTFAPVVEVEVLSEQEKLVERQQLQQLQLNRSRGKRYELYKKKMEKKSLPPETWAVWMKDEKLAEDEKQEKKLKKDEEMEEEEAATQAAQAAAEAEASGAGASAVVDTTVVDLTNFELEDREQLYEYDFTRPFCGPAVAIKLFEEDSLNLYDVVIEHFKKIATPEGADIPNESVFKDMLDSLRNSMTLAFADPCWGNNTSVTQYGGIDLVTAKWTTCVLLFIFKAPKNKYFFLL